MKSTVDDVMHPQYPVRNLFLNCRSGWHRAGVCGQHLQCALNYMSLPGGRVFNAKLFALVDHIDDDEYNARMRGAIEWTRNPWISMQGGRCDHKHLYAYEACRTHRVAFTHFKECWQRIDDILAELQQGEIAHRESRAPRSPPPFANAPWHSERPRWATFEHSAENWWELLDSLGVDSQARADLFCLANTSAKGREAAMNIIFKILKKLNDGERYETCASAFVHICVKNAMEKLNAPTSTSRRAEY